MSFDAVASVLVAWGIVGWHHVFPLKFLYSGDFELAMEVTESAGGPNGGHQKLCLIANKLHIHLRGGIGEPKAASQPREDEQWF